MGVLYGIVFRSRARAVIAVGAEGRQISHGFRVETREGRKEGASWLGQHAGRGRLPRSLMCWGNGTLRAFLKRFLPPSKFQEEMSCDVFGSGLQFSQFPPPLRMIESHLGI